MTSIFRLLLFKSFYSCQTEKIIIDVNSKINSQNHQKIYSNDSETQKYLAAACSDTGVVGSKLLCDFMTQTWDAKKIAKDNIKRKNDAKKAATHSFQKSRNQEITEMKKKSKDAWLYGLSGATQAFMQFGPAAINAYQTRNNNKFYLQNQFNYRSMLYSSDNTIFQPNYSWDPNSYNQNMTTMGIANLSNFNYYLNPIGTTNASTFMPSTSTSLISPISTPISTTVPSSTTLYNLAQ
jgi:hypothetical protein